MLWKGSIVGTREKQISVVIYSFQGIANSSSFHLYKNEATCRCHTSCPQVAVLPSSQSCPHHSWKVSKVTVGTE